jgi:hypothetical protein
MEEPMETKGGKSPPMKATLEGSDGNPPNNHYGYRKPVIRQPKFKRCCKELKGHIFDCSTACQVDVFTKAVKENATFIGSTYKYGGDMKIAVETLTYPILNEPTDPPAGASQMQCHI